MQTLRQRLFTMETPLDVLSRAATLVETDPKEGGDMGFSLGGRSDSPKELPSRVNRQRRSVERREGPLVMKWDAEHNHKATSTATTSTRCASTQTLITSEMVGIPEINPDLPIPSSSSLMSEDTPCPPYRSPAVPPTSVSSSCTSHPSPHALRHRGMPPQPLRPSVITCAPAPAPLLRDALRPEGAAAAVVGAQGGGPPPLPLVNGRGGSSNGSAERWSARMHPNHLSAQAQAQSQAQNAEVDPDIEEHFRRSLGRDYRENYSSPPPSATLPPSTLSSTMPRQSASSPPSSAAAAPNVNEISITGSVDDHFAKALGDKWSQIKDVIEPATNRTSPSASPTLAVPSSPVVQQQQQASVAS